MKAKTHLKVSQINKGNSDFDTAKFTLYKEILDNKADLAIISEANLKNDDETSIKTFKNYKMESKFMLGHNKARLVVLINNKLNYTRMKQFEEDDLSCLWLKINICKRKHLYMCCVYRQWNLPSSMDKPESGNVHNQLDRLRRVLIPLDDLCDKGHDVVISGDINIDQLLRNNASKRWDLCKLNDCLNESMTRNSLVLMNNKPTRFRAK